MSIKDKAFRLKCDECKSVALWKYAKRLGGEVLVRCNNCGETWIEVP